MPTTPTVEELLKKPETPAPAPKKRIAPFNDLARSFDPMMPKAEYEQHRDFYFDKYVAPHYKSDADRTAGQQKFNSLTERKPLLTTGEKAALPLSIAASQFFAKAEDTVAGVDNFLNEKVNKHLWGYEAGQKEVASLRNVQKGDEAKVDHLEKLAAREGMSTSASVGKAVGSLGEAGVELAGLGGVEGATTGLVKGLDLIKAGGTTAKYLKFANRLTKGGPTFAVYEGLHDQNGLAHSFIDGTFLKGMVEGRLWHAASTGKLISRVVKGGVIGGGLGAAHADKGQTGSSALVGGVMGAVLGLLPGEVEQKDVNIKKALTPDVSRPLEPKADEVLSQSAMQASQKASREGKASEINVNEDLRGVKIRVSDPKGGMQEISISPYAEGKALDLVQKVTAAGGKVEGIDYSTTHGDTLNRFLHMQKLVENGSPEVEKSIALEAKQPIEAPAPNKVDEAYGKISTADRIVSTHSNLPKSSNLYPDLVSAKKTSRDVTSELKEHIIWKANQVGSTNEERKFLNYYLTNLFNNRNLPSVNPEVNSQLRLLAYKPELRDSLPPQFRSEFDTAVLQAPKGQKFETSLFNFKDSYKILASISPRRTPDELIEMSKLHAVIKDGEPKGIGLSESQEMAQSRRAAYNDAYNKSLSYPEVGEALPPNQRIAWTTARQNKIDSDIKQAEIKQKQVLQKPVSDKPVVSKRDSRQDIKDIWEKNRFEREEAKLRDAGKIPHPPTFHEEFEIPELRDLEPSEIDQVMKEEIEKKSRGIDTSGAAEEFLRTGQWTRGEMGKKMLASELRVPPAEERGTLTMGENARIEDGVLKVYVPSHVIERQYAMAGAFYQPNQVLKVLEELGFKDHPNEVMDYLLQGKRMVDPMNGNMLAGYGNGMVVLPAEQPVQHELHELLHHGMDYVIGALGYHPEHFGLSDVASRTMQQIQREIAQIGTYKGIHDADANEEAFVHAATAVIKGDNNVLAAMGLVDTSTTHVVSMVHEVANKALTKLQTRPDWQELRDVKNRFEAVKKSSSPLVSYSLRTASDRLQSNFYTLDDGAVVFKSRDSTRVFQNKNEAFQHMLLEDHSAEVPSWTAVLEQVGVLTDSPTLAKFSPSHSPITRDPSAEADVWKKRMTATDLIRPMASFVGDVQKKLDEHWQGKQSVDLLSKVKAVDQAFHDNSAWVDSQREAFSKSLKKFSSEKLYDVFNFISVDPKNWPTMQGKYNMTPHEIEGVKEVYDKLRNLDATQHLGIFNYFLRELPVLRSNDFRLKDVYSELKDPSKMSTMQRGVVSGRLKPQDTHAGRFINFALEASRQKVMEKPITELRQTLDLKDKDGNYILGPLRGSFNRYAEYMNFHPDATQKFVNDVTSSMQGMLLNQFKRLNKHLPEGSKLPEEFEYPGALINKLMTISYAADVGFRASAAIRDTIQPYLTSLPILGMKNIAKGMKLGLTPGGYDAAQKAGALLHGSNVTELYGDMFSEIPVGGHSLVDKGVQAAGKLLSPSRWGHNVGRLFVYHGTLDAADTAITQLRSGKITPDKFLNDTGLWFLSKPERSAYLTKAMDNSNERGELSKRIALDMVDRTLWAYRRGQQPGMLRTGAGRIFGQYGMWPLNFGEYIRTIGARALEGGSIGKRAIQAGAMWLGVNLATYEAFDKGAGIDAGKWLFLSPAGFAGGPATGAALNALPAAAQAGSILIGQQGTTEGQKALHEEITTPLHLLPGSNWSRSMLGTVDNPEYWNDDNTPTSKGWIKLLGFKPVDEKEEQLDEQRTFEQQLRKRSGFKPGGGDIFGNP